MRNTILAIAFASLLVPGVAGAAEQHADDLLYLRVGAGVAEVDSPLDTGTGSGFRFRTDSRSAYVVVDRTGMPALATALIPGSDRNAYNDDDVADDLSSAANGEFKWVPTLRASLVGLTNALADDFREAGLAMCARPS